MSTITLTESQRQAIKAEMETQTEMLSDIEVEALATMVNAKVNIPYIKEGSEQTILVKTVKKFDQLLYKNLPNELYSLVKDSHDGISDSDAKQLEGVLGSRLNSQFEIPYLPEVIEQKIFELLIAMIVSAMRKEFSVLNQAEVA